MDKSLIFIPDISGFTEFTTTTEINHSAHIVADLLGIILSQDKLGLTLSEIEGDALLFVKKENVPPLEAIIEQAKEMYKAFHTHLLKYTERRVCDCGACTMAPNLSVKFFAHQGDLVEVEVGNLIKFHGTGMIIIHRLMKNNVKGDDYLLLSDSFNLEDIKHDHFESGTMNFPHLGDVNYTSLDLSKQKEGLHLTTATSKPFNNNFHTISETIILDSGIQQIYRDLGDLSIKEKVMASFAQIKKTNQTMNFIGNEHLCIVDGNRINIVTAGINNNADEYKMVEEILNMPFINRAQKSYKLKKLEEGKTELVLEFKYTLKSGFLAGMVKGKISNKMAKMAKSELDQMNKFYNNGK